MDSTALPTLRRIAEAAGAEIMAVYRSDFTHRRKADDSPVTEADRRASVVGRVRWTGGSRRVARGR